MTLEEFKKLNKPKDHSSIDPFFEDIKDLVNNKHSQKKIVEFLKSNGVTTTQQNLSRWIKKNINIQPQKMENKSKEINIREKTITENPINPIDELDNFFNKKK